MNRDAYPRDADTASRALEVGRGSYSLQYDIGRWGIQSEQRVGRGWLVQLGAGHVTITTGD